MSCQPYRAYYTAISPFTEAGTVHASLWKKAMTITDFFHEETLKKNRVKCTVKLLFDDEFLYVCTKAVAKVPYIAPQEEGAPFYCGTHFELFLPAAENAALRIAYRPDEEKQIRYDNREEKVSLPGLKIVMQNREKNGLYEWETWLAVPFRHITKEGTAPATFGFGLMHNNCQAEGPVQYESHVISIADISSKPGSFYLTFPVELCREGKAAGGTCSARKIFLEANRNVTLTLSPEKASGNYKNILGMNNSPRISAHAATEPEKELFKRLAPARVRHHDAALVDPGYALIDVSRIFPLFHADHNDPANYDFGPTDFYLEQVMDCGVELEFHFTESIEHSARRFRVFPPSDPEKWSAICINILRHYCEGWANGKTWDIPYVTLWEEPDNSHLFDGPYENYLQLYKEFSIQLKKAFPHIKVGGPNTIRVAPVEEFLAYCREHSLPVDVVCTTGYARTPEFYVGKMQELRKLADKYGFHDAEHFLTEWNMSPRDWGRMDLDRNKADSMQQAAFSLATLISLQDLADMAYYYIWAASGQAWGLFNLWREPFKNYYGLVFYTDFVRKDLKRVPTAVSAIDAKVYQHCGIDSKGNVHMILSLYGSAAEELTFMLPAEYKTCTVKVLSDAFPSGEGVITLKSDRDGAFHFPLEAKRFGVYALEFRK